MGKACHQCRQKRPVLVGSCATRKKTTSCPLRLCPRCLYNGFEETPEEVALNNNWTCPKCRGDCICSVCMTEKGLMPTGNLMRIAKKYGYKTIAAFRKDPISHQFIYRPIQKPENAVVVSLEELAQETHAAKKSKKSEGEEPKDINGCGDHENAALVIISSAERMEISDSETETDVSKEEGKNKRAANDIEGNNIAAKKSKKSEGEEPQDINGCGDKNAALVISSLERMDISDSVHKTETDVAKEVVLAEGKNKKAAITRPAAITRSAPKKKKEVHLEEVKLPEGTRSITVFGIDLPPEDVGDAFQFLEFCSTFGEVLDLTNVQVECVICEIFSGRSTRSPLLSTLSQTIIHLLTVIMEDRGQSTGCLTETEESWFTTLAEIISKSKGKLDCFPSEMSQEGVDSYEKMDSSTRIKLLNFLCDETLGTLMLRSFINSEEEAREKLREAKSKEKLLTKRLQDVTAKAVFDNSGNPLTLEKDNEIVSPIIAEIEEAQSEIQTAMEMLPKKGQEHNDVLRTSMVELEDNGVVVWKLNSYKEEPNVLVQDLGSWSDVCPHEKWFAFRPEQKPEIEKYLSFKRMKRLREKKEAQAKAEAEKAKAEAEKAKAEAEKAKELANTQEENEAKTEEE